MQRCRRGDLGAFEELYKRYGSRLYTVAYRMTGSAADAEDLVQDIFLQVYRRLDTFRGEAALGTWLHRLAVNACLDFVRSKQGRRQRVTDSAEDLDALEPPAPGSWRAGCGARSDGTGTGDRAAAAELPAGLPAARRGRPRASRGRRDAGHCGRHVEVAALQGTDAPSRSLLRGRAWRTVMDTRTHAADRGLRPVRGAHPRPGGRRRSTRARSPELDAHLASCAACRGLRPISTPSRGRAADIPDLTPRARGLDRLSARLAAEAAARPRPFWTGARVALAMAATLVVAVTSSVWLLRAPAPPAPAAAGGRGGAATGNPIRQETSSKTLTSTCGSPTSTTRRRLPGSSRW